VPLASVAVVALGFRGSDLGMRLDGYGFLVARGEGPTLLGCQYESSVFPGRAPSGGTLLRVIMGGTFHPDVVAEQEGTLVDRAIAELGVIAGLRVRPEVTATWRLPQVLPQYRLGHEQRARDAEAELARLPGLHLLGTGLRGSGLADCIRNATALASSLR